MTVPVYEIYAIKYAELERKAFGNFVDSDVHETSDMPLDYFVWAIVGEERVFVVDTGFDGEMAKKRGTVPVVDTDQRVVGVVTNGDLMRLMEETEHVFPIPVRDVMSRNPKTIGPDALAASAVNQMENHGIVALPVVDTAGRLTGIVHLHDCMRAGVV